MAKVNTDPIKKCLLSCQSCLQEQSREKVITPFGKMLQQVMDMTSSTNLSLKSIEPEMNYLEYLQPSMFQSVLHHSLLLGLQKDGDFRDRHTVIILTCIQNYTCINYTVFFRFLPVC